MPAAQSAAAAPVARATATGNWMMRIIHLLRGAPGVLAELPVRKDGSKQPIALRIRRGPLPDQDIDNLALPWLH